MSIESFSKNNCKSLLKLVEEDNYLIIDSNNNKIVLNLQ